MPRRVANVQAEKPKPGAMIRSTTLENAMVDPLTANLKRAREHPVLQEVGLDWAITGH